MGIMTGDLLQGEPKKKKSPQVKKDMSNSAKGNSQIAEQL